MMSSYSANPIFFNNKKKKIGLPEHSLTRCKFLSNSSVGFFEFFEFFKLSELTRVENGKVFFGIGTVTHNSNSMSFILFQNNSTLILPLIFNYIYTEF